MNILTLLKHFLIALAPFTLNQAVAQLSENPLSVPQGFWQIESDLFTYSRDASIPDLPGAREVTYSVGITNFIYGISDNIDLQLSIEPYSEIHYASPDGITSISSGFGDITLRTKYRFTPINPSGTWAFLPYLKIPTADHAIGNQKIEGGFLLPFSTELAHGWDFGFQPGAEWIRLDPTESQNYAFTPLAAFIFGHQINPHAALFFELSGAYDTFTSSDSLALNFHTGGTYSLKDEVLLDLSFALGLTRAATDLTILASYTHRW